MGIFCGVTYISNAGAGLGPGACYTANRLVGIEIDPESAHLAQKNVASLDSEQKGEIISADGLQWLEEFNMHIDLLYIDATAPGPEGKALYLNLLKKAVPKLEPGSLVLAHNSVNDANTLSEYLNFVRDKSNFSESMNIIIDPMGLEISKI